jgi:hypothetical protein
MRFKDIEINIKASPDTEDEALLQQLIGAKGLMIQTMLLQFIHYNKKLK